MQIIREPRYINKLQDIMEFIAKDNITQALKFQIDLDNDIMNLANMPYKCRQSIYFKSKEIRDLIFKAYVVPYKIDKINNIITIIGITKYTNKF